MISFVVLHGLKVGLHLWACGGRTAPAVEAHSCVLWQSSKWGCCEVALRDACIAAGKSVGAGIGNARRPEVLILSILGITMLWYCCSTRHQSQCGKLE